MIRQSIKYRLENYEVTIILHALMEKSLVEQSDIIKSEINNLITLFKLPGSVCITIDNRS